MPNLVIIRLSPRKPTDGANFTNDLVGLKIAITDMSFKNPSGMGNTIGSAFYDPANAASSIVQHLLPPMYLSLAAVATAAIVINEPPAYPEYVNPDLRLTITRGTQTIVDQSLNYNASVDGGGALPAGLNPFAYAALSPVALYLALPDSSLGLNPGQAFVNVPTDGSPPNYNDLKSNVIKVLDKDPGAAQYDLKALTQPQCRHIAYEIIWNRDINPLPVPPDSLEELYTLPDASSNDNSRQKFESDLITYYTTSNAQAEALAKYVFALSAALACEQNSNAAANVGFDVPVLPGIGGSGGQTEETEVILS